MLDYTLVSPRATYRVPTPRDLPVLVRLVQDHYREDHPALAMPADQVLATVHELSHHKEKGTVFLFEQVGELVGYSILINVWSNERGGTIISVDELYVVPDRRGKGIGTDFLTLLSRVAPKGTVALELEVTHGKRRAFRLYRRLGFRDQGRALLLLPLVPGPRPE